jgi:hypothetical protein
MTNPPVSITKYSAFGPNGRAERTLGEAAIFDRSKSEQSKLVAGTRDEERA